MTTVYLVYAKYLGRDTLISICLSRKVADEMIAMFDNSKEYWVLEEPVVTRLYQKA